MRAVSRSAAFCVFLVAGSAFAVTPALATWDSIAVDDDTGTRAGGAGYGVGEGDSKAAAEGAAMKECKKTGNSGCTIEVSYKDMCGAYASSKKYSGHGTGHTKAQATKSAIETCGDGACKLVVADCVGQD